ncbi:hypothetical protein N0A02_32000 [Paraburkholderia acidicola]|uniref:Uncharacterized protein n=1 Tax=Paraburkholderia acidicola TaxID=1912599 RepID=A0ABV1LY05_9BURK
MNEPDSITIEGIFAHPRSTLFDGIPFGREWTYRGMHNALIAWTKTTCIDVEAPHIRCDWTPPGNAEVTPPSLPVVPPVIPGAPVLLTAATVPTAAAMRRRRAIFATGLSISGFGIIGWLIVAHTPTSHVTTSVHVVSGPTVGDSVRPSIPAPRDIEQSHDRPAATTPTANVPQAPPERIAGVTSSSAAPLSQHEAIRTEARAKSSGSREKFQNERLAAARSRSWPTIRKPAAAPAPRVVAQAAPPLDPEDAIPPFSMSAVLEEPIEIFDNARHQTATVSASTTQPAAAYVNPSREFGSDWTTRLAHQRLTDAPDAFTRSSFKDEAR